MVVSLVKEMEKNKKWVISAAVVALVLSVLLCLIPTIVGEPEKGIDRPWLDFLGNFHPLILHFPIGVLIMVLIMEVGGWFVKSWKANHMLPLLINAASAFIASVLGMLWYYSGSSGESKLLDDHLLQGTIYGVIALWLPLVYYVFQKKRVVYVVGLFIATGVMTSAAHLGGEATHGNILKKAPWKLKKRKKTVHDPIVYTEIIVPIFEEKCYKCHHSEERERSGFKMDTVADILVGGDEQDYEAALVPGDASKSSIVTTLELPLDDDFHMPPEGKKQLTEDEIALVKWWVNTGASDSAKLSEVEATDEIKAILKK